ncbi:glycosyltransferase family 39 protein [Methanolobus psychrotolerans]|uniref:glycosyltransferase family 39 protein n=1 Tax=Methanolobus psychrotolerans TaxID=1874706 RepID=UPI0013EC2CB2|nr:glycosyltransferase family 39 protein [Methanolobus psychrotolerans]
MGNKKTTKNISTSSINSESHEQSFSFVHIKKAIIGNSYALLFFITLIGMILRFYRLGAESIWLDEGTSIQMAKQSLYTIIFDNKDFAHPPLFYSILHFVIMYSDSEFFVRLPSAIFGTLSIPLIYLLGSSFFSKREGLISSFLMAISVMQINYSQEGRSYALMMLLALLTIYLFISAYKDNNRTKWIISAISGTLLVYSHFFGFFVIGAIGIFYILDNFDFVSLRFNPKSTDKMFMISAVSFVLLSLPMILWVLGELGYATGHKTWGMAQEGFFYNIFISFSNYSKITMFMYIPLMLAGLVFCLKDSKKWFSLIALWLFIPLVTGYFLAGSMPFQPRYLLFIMPAFLLLISKAIVSIADILTTVSNSDRSVNRGKKRTVSEAKNKSSNNTNGKSMFVIISVVMLVILISYTPLYNYYTTSHKNDWRDTSVFIASITEPGDYVAPLPGYMGQALMYYYDNSSDGTFYANTQYSESGLTSYVKGKQRVWFLVTGDISAANPNGSAVSWLQNNAFFVKNITGIYIFTYPAL